MFMKDEIIRSNGWYSTQQSTGGLQYVINIEIVRRAGRLSAYVSVLEYRVQCMIISPIIRDVSDGRVIAAKNES